MPHVLTTCPYCGCGCGLYLQVEGHKVLGTTASDAEGDWAVTLAQGLSVGSHVLRVEVLNVEGEAITTSQPVVLNVVEVVSPQTGGDSLPWSSVLMVTAALLGLGLIFALGGAALRAWERTRRY